MKKNKISLKVKKIIKIVNIIFYVLVVAIILHTIINFKNIPAEAIWVEQLNMITVILMGLIYIIFAIIVKKVFNFLVKKFIKE